MKKIILSFLLSMFVIALHAQYATNFDTDTPGAPPNGWTSYTTQTDDPGFMVFDSVSIAQSPNNILAHLGTDISQTSDAWIVSPAITLGNNQELVFYWRMKWSYDYDYTGVYISTGSNDPIANSQDFNELAEFDPNNYPTWNSWNKAMFDLSSYAGQTVYIAFKYTGDFAHDFYVDDFEVRNIPYCNPTTNIDFVSSTDTTVDISWDAVQGVNEYEVIWGPQGFDPNTGTPVMVTGNTYTITGLQPATWYDVYVRTYCSSYNYSSWSGPEAVRTMGPIPVNDTCAGAINLTVYPVGGGAGNETQGDTYDATPSAMSHTSCDSFGDNLDLFYTFTAPADGNMVVITGGPQGDAIEAAIYDACAGNEVACFGNGNTKIVTGLTPGQTYILQIWHDSSNKGQFNIVLEELPPPPANNDCANAESLTVYPAGGGAGNETDGDTTYALPSNMAHTSCDSFGDNYDLFYSFVAPAGGVVNIIRGGANGNNIEAAVYDACGGNEVACFGSGGAMIVSGLTPGQTYILQVWHDSFNAGPFNIVLEEGPSAPSNNDCTGAQTLTVYPYGGGAGNETSASTVAATPSNMAHTSCDSFGDNYDLFYTFTAPADGSVAIITGGAEGNQIEAAVYDACGGNEIACFGNGSYKLVTGLTPGQTYILQVWHDSFNAGDFTIVLEEAPPAPSNDLCADAIDVPVTSSCSPVFGHNTGATDSGVADPGCANYQGGDIWFMVTVPSDGNVDIETTQGNVGSVGDTGMAVYSGDCNNLSLIECNDDGGSVLFSKVSLTGRTPGEILYVRVWEYGNNAYGEIGVCAYNPNVSIGEIEAYGFSFYPNPAQSQITFKAERNIDRVQIVNLTGQILMDLRDMKNKAVNISELPQGVYLIIVQINGKEGTYRLIKE